MKTDSFFVELKNYRGFQRQQISSISKYVFYIHSIFLQLPKENITEWEYLLIVRLIYKIGKRKICKDIIHKKTYYVNFDWFNAHHIWALDIWYFGCSKKDIHYWLYCIVLYLATYFPLTMLLKFAASYSLSVNIPAIQSGNCIFKKGFKTNKIYDLFSI